ncbi:MAG: flagellar hook-length control protein FliK [Clostridia bacterium]|nr:flagellar hook-length control protein FliK [Clostridia bacterium]
MITQRSGLQYIANMLPVMPEIETKRVGSFNKNNSYDFKNFLDKASKSPVDQRRDNPMQYGRSKDLQSRSVDQRERVENYGEAKRNSKTNNGADKLDSQRDLKKTYNEAKKVNDDKPQNTKKVKTEAVTESLAQALGIKQDDIMKILESLNIKGEELADSAKINEIVQKLSALLGLDNKKMAQLAELLSVINEKADALLKKTKAEGATAGDAADTVEAAKDKDPQKHEFVKPGQGEKLQEKEQSITVKDTLNLSKLVNEFKTRMEELLQKYQQNQEAVSKEITGTLEEVLVAANGESLGTKDTNVNTKEKTMNLKNDKDIDKESTGQEDIKAAQEKDANKSDSKQEEAKGGLPGELKKAEVQGIKGPGEKNDDNRAVKFNEAISNQTQKTAEVKETAKVHREVPVPKSEIINQVIEKAKVTLNGDKSEMSMELKPESLGKLTLKVITERGVVMAKFVAESQQVKEVLESNMQLLKDTLEKQGLAVQGFSVSVNQDSSKGFRREEFSQNQTSGKNSGISPLGSKMVQAAELPDRQDKVNPYHINDNRINLTA